MSLPEENAFPEGGGNSFKPTNPSIQQFHPDTTSTKKLSTLCTRNVLISVGVVCGLIVTAIIVAVLVTNNRSSGSTSKVCVISNSAGCTSMLSENLQDVVLGCQQDIGICSGALCEECSDYCCGAVFEETTAACGVQQVVFSKVTGCTCQPCSSFQISISGRIAGACTSESSCAMSIQINSAEVTRSNTAGYYTFPVTYPSSGRVVFSAVDDDNQSFLTQIKIVDVSRDAQSCIVDDINVVAKADPVTFSAAAGADISLGTDDSVGIAFNPNSIMKENGTVHTGNVSASINFVDTTIDNATSTISGELSTTLANGSNALLSSSGMFTVSLTDPMTGNSLTARGVNISLDSDELSALESANTLLWIQNDKGFWTQVSSMQATSSSTRRRKKRQTSGNAVTGTIDITSATQIYNLDRLVWPYCYMKVRLFSDDQLTMTNQVPGLQVTSVYRTASGSWSNYLKTHTYSGGACIPVPCNRDSWRVVEKVYVQVAGYDAYDPQIFSDTATRVNYTSATNAFVITIPISGDIVHGSSGPFYKYSSQCHYGPGLSDSYFRFVRTVSNASQTTEAGNSTLATDIEGLATTESSTSGITEPSPSIRTPRAATDIKGLTTTDGVTSGVAGIAGSSTPTVITPTVTAVITIHGLVTGDTTTPITASVVPLPDDDQTTIVATATGLDFHLNVNLTIAGVFEDNGNIVVPIINNNVTTVINLRIVFDESANIIASIFGDFEYNETVVMPISVSTDNTAIAMVIAGIDGNDITLVIPIPNDRGNIAATTTANLNRLGVNATLSELPAESVTSSITAVRP